MYIVPHESNRYLCFDKPKTFQSWQKYTTAGMIAFNNEEQNGTKAGLERCRKNAAKVVKNKVKWDHRKKMAMMATKAAMKKTIQMWLPFIPGVGKIFDIPDLGFGFMDDISRFLQDRAKKEMKKMQKRAKQAASFVEDKTKETLQPMDYGNCKGALQQLAYLKASTMKIETDTEDEDEDGAEEGQQSRNKRCIRFSLPSCGCCNCCSCLPCCRSRKNVQNKDVQVAKTESVKEKNGKMDKMLDWMRQKVVGPDTMHATINRLSDADLKKNIKDAEMFLLQERKLGLAPTARWGCMGKIKDPEARKALTQKPKDKEERKDDAIMRKMHEQYKPSDICDVSEFNIVQKRYVNNQKKYCCGLVCFSFCGYESRKVDLGDKADYIELELQGPVKYCCSKELPSCFREKKKMIFQKNQEYTVNRIFNFDMNQSQPYFYDEKKVPKSRRFKRDAYGAPQQQTMSRSGSAPRKAPQQQTMQ